MPTSKQARARQARQKQRVAELHATREQKKRRNRRVGAGLIALLLIVGIILAVAGGSLTSDDDKASPATTPPSTTAAIKRCVGLKDPLPKGAPTVAIPAGAAAPELETKDVKVGTGAVVPKNAPAVTVNYVGIACTTGKVFDSSYSRNKPFTANLDPNGASNTVIAGWQQGIPGMKVGGVRLLQIPAALAYGATGQPPTIGPNEPLFFIVSAVRI